MGTQTLKNMETKQCNKCNEVKPVSEYHKNGKYYYSMCKQCKVEYRKENYERESAIRKIRDTENKEIIADKKREYRKTSDVYKQYRIDNKERNRQYNKEYYKQNKSKVNKQKREYYKNKYNTNELFRLSENIRRGISLSFKKNGFPKSGNTRDILGCSYEEFKQHIEALWEPWMNWDNYGLYNGEPNYGWDIDHTIPSSSAQSEKDVIKLNHHTNLKPLCSYYNRDIKKHNPID